MSDQTTADLIAALKLLVDTGFPVTDEYYRSHWAISEAQRRIAREAIAKAEANAGRSSDCVEALVGIEDPAAFMRAVWGLAEAALEVADELQDMYGASVLRDALQTLDTTTGIGDPKPTRSKYAGLFDQLFAAWNGGDKP